MKAGAGICSYAIDTRHRPFFAYFQNALDKGRMTSAALYRHFQDKQGMFAAMVRPALEELDAWKERHAAYGYAALEQESPELMWDFEK